MDASVNQQRPWPWSSGIERPDQGTATGNLAPDREATGAGRAEPAGHDAGSQVPSRPQCPYQARTCRICLEVVQPVVDVNDSLPELIAGRPKVRYVSEDPEAGRLISPCRCKGSQKYVHEGCLQAWRQQSPLADRNFFRCPTCSFEYRIERLRWAHWLSSKLLRVFLTAVILLASVFFLGFIADPIINFWVDPVGSVVETIADVVADVEATREATSDEPFTWSFHFIKGFLSLGLLGFLKTLFALSPWQWYNIRAHAAGHRRGGTGRDRLESINWALVLIGVVTFLGTTWKVVNHLTARALENASERVADIQADDEDDEDDET